MPETAQQQPGATPAVRLRDVRFAWAAGGPLVLDVPAFDMAAGARVFLQGPSGSGKSTLLGVIAGVLRADAGDVRVLGTTLSEQSGARRDAFRAAHLGVIFQMFNLLPYLSMLDNVCLPCRLSTPRRDTAIAASGSVEAEARRLLARLGLEGDILHRPVTQLSVGQQQRVAAARALIGGPALIIADEPTSALDTDARDRFLDVLVEDCARTNAALLFVSHDAALASHFERAEDLRALNRVCSARMGASA